MSLTSSLLRKQPCKWRNCDVVMNTIDKLSQHVALHGRNKPVHYVFVVRSAQWKLIHLTLGTLHMFMGQLCT